MGKIILFIVVCFLIYHVVKLIRKDRKQAQNDDPTDVDDLTKDLNERLGKIKDTAVEKSKEYEQKAKYNKKQATSAEELKRKINNN